MRRLARLERFPVDQAPPAEDARTGAPAIDPPGVAGHSPQPAPTRGFSDSAAEPAQTRAPNAPAGDRVAPNGSKDGDNAGISERDGPIATASAEATPAPPVPLLGAEAKTHHALATAARPVHEAAPNPAPEPQPDTALAASEAEASDDKAGAATAAQLDALAGAIDSMADRLDDYRRSMGAAAAQAFGDAARRCLPQAANAETAERLVSAAQALTDACHGGTLELRVAPPMVRPLAEALDRRQPVLPCVIAGDPGLGRDRAEIAWRSEGCWPDPEQLAGAASAILDDAIARHSRTGENG
ncbi:MAG: hypothetical protein AAF577_09410 [Pseudomonadota bacterium]